MQIAFYKVNRPGVQGLFSRLVRWWTHGPYSHCELVLGTDREGLSRCGSSSYIDGGVRIKDIALDPAHWDVVEVQGNSARAAQWFLEHNGQGYDLLGLLFFVLRRRDGAADRWLCSESVAAALGWAEPWRFDPNTFAAAARSQA